MTREPSSLTVKYGYRTLIILTILLIYSVFLLAEYIVSRESNSFLLVLFIIFILLTIILFAGFRLTVVRRIEKKYFNVNSLTGLNGKVLKGAKAGERGSLIVSNEDWSFVCDSDTSDGEIVRIDHIDEDRVTLKTTKIS